MNKELHLGIDVGSVSTNIVLIDMDDKVVEKLYLRTNGRPIDAICKGLSILNSKLDEKTSIVGAGTTGSGRQLAGALIGADVMKNEITAHAVAACHVVPDVRTILEIGGQDSKIILIKDGMVCDFAMNSVCAAGTGSFLDRQASRLEIPIEEFGGYALRSKSPVRIAGRCAVFAESDMISKQQAGHSAEDIIAGLCEALVRNYLNNLAKGKKIGGPVLFQGGVAANVGILSAFEKALAKKVIIPQHYDVMGAYGAALIARDEMALSNKQTRFKGFENLNREFVTESIACTDCANMCEVIRIKADGACIAHWGDRCGKWGQRMDTADQDEKSNASEVS